ncbi:MAG: hypothetical protein IPK73_11830 [Candidatus Obscuribacter sp.]|nr:hypothetical protein [Candidatus Obscuribacter sp.]MBK9281710.1 hypothetical protein [Candidatus Obscuribacter sp.]HMX46850.1 hypothetical protein [Candidatus Obscuribacter sp.]HND08233.1 hypothetical protein [Candidatus Obscuribacter sp.]
MDTDFDLVLGTPIPENNVENPSAALYKALEDNDLNSVIKLLRETGSCNWNNLLPDKDFQLQDSLGKWRHFSVHLSTDQKDTELEILERIESGVLRNPDIAYLPRVSVKDANCIEDQSGTPGQELQKEK